MNVKMRETISALQKSNSSTFELRGEEEKLDASHAVDMFDGEMDENGVHPTFS